MSDSKKNVVIVAAVFYPEPIVSANLLFELACELSKKYNVTVLRPKPTRPLGFKTPNWDSKAWPFKEIVLDTFTSPQSKIIGRFRESISHGKAAAKYIKAHHKNIDFIFNDSWHLFGINIVARTAVKYGIPYITPVQDIYPESLVSKLPKISTLQRMVRSLLLPIDKYNLSHAARIHTISEGMVETLAATRNIDKNKFYIVRNWQDDRQFTDYIATKTSKENDNEPFTFMYLGNVGHLAGLEMVIAAFKNVKVQNVRFVIAGGGAAKEALMRDAVDDRRIEFWDVPAGQVPAIQDKADVMVLPVKKGFALSSIPSKLPAYMFSAKPVLASVDAESDTAMCIKKSEGGWVIPPEDNGEMTKQMHDCIAEYKQILTTMGTNGREFALKNLSREQNLNVLVNTCIEVIENSK